MNSGDTIRNFAQRQFERFQPLREHLRDDETRLGVCSSAIVMLVQPDVSILNPSNWQSRQTSGPDVITLPVRNQER